MSDHDERRDEAHGRETMGLDGATQSRSERASPGGGLLDRLQMPVEVRFGSLRWPLARLLALRVGDAVPIGVDGDDTVTLYVQGRPYAEGELLVVDGKFAFRVQRIVSAGEAS